MISPTTKTTITMMTVAIPGDILFDISTITSSYSKYATYARRREYREYLKTPELVLHYYYRICPLLSRGFSYVWILILLT